MDTDPDRQAYPYPDPKNDADPIGSTTLVSSKGAGGDYSPFFERQCGKPFFKYFLGEIFEPRTVATGALAVRRSNH
jgi:hypothetical protein